MSLLPQFGFFELMLVAVIALIVVGPKDLPKLMRSAGQMVAKARAMAGEFTAAFDQMAREADMEELRKEIDDLKKNNPVADAKRAVEETLAPIDKTLRDEAGEVRDAMTKPTTDAKPMADMQVPGGDAGPVPDPAAPTPKASEPEAAAAPDPARESGASDQAKS